MLSRLKGKRGSVPVEAVIAIVIVAVLFTIMITLGIKDNQEGFTKNQEQEIINIISDALKEGRNGEIYSSDWGNYITLDDMATEEQLMDTRQELHSLAEYLGVYIHYNQKAVKKIVK